MTVVYIAGEAGRLEADCLFHDNPASPIVIMMHHHAFVGGGKDFPLFKNLATMFKVRGFSCVRFNSRGIGNSQGSVTDGEGELMDAADVLDWVQERRPKASAVWVVGLSFGAWIAMQLAARRPEITDFVALSPPASLYDFSFLDESFCQARGLIVTGASDSIVPHDYMLGLAAWVGNTTLKTIPDADHFFNKHEEDVVGQVADFTYRSLAS